MLCFFLYFSIPSQIILPENTRLSINTIPIGSLQSELSQQNENLMIKSVDNTVEINSSVSGDYGYSYTLFNNIPIKQVNISVVPKRYVIPSGETIGVKMYTDGLLVIHVSSVTGKDMSEHYPAKEAGISEGDRILSVDGIKLTTNEDFSDYINKTKRSVTLEIARDDKVFKTDITPILSNDGDKYKIGLWVRDSTAGIGTMTYYDPENNEYGALGHAITDSDTGSILTVLQGSLIDCDVVSVKKGESGKPGELTGSFSGGNIGSILSNNQFGIYGYIDKKVYKTDIKPIEAATRFQVKEGTAKILCDVDGQGVKSYNVEIIKISKDATLDNKGIIIKVTDDELLNKTGGIVQGMSGSPIVQNGKLVGAVTHVFVNDPTRGYGIFIENMLSEAEKIK